MNDANNPPRYAYQKATFNTRSADGTGGASCAPSAARKRKQGVKMTQEIITLRVARLRASMRQTDLAHAVGMCTGSIYKYEHGKMNPSPKALALLHWALEFDYVTLAAVPPPPPTDYRQVIPVCSELERGPCGDLLCMDNRLTVDWGKIDLALEQWRASHT